MSLGARPLGSRDVRAIIDKKMADFEHVSGGLRLLHLDIDTYLETAEDDPDVRMALETGFIEDLSEELRDPVIVELSDRVVYTCPPLAIRVLADEPPEIHRAFVEGAFFRKFFCFFVPAAHEGGARWEASEQVRDIMQRHFAFQLVVTETVLGKAS